MPYAGLPKNEEFAASPKEANKVGALIHARTTDIRNTGWNIVMDHYYGYLYLIETPQVTLI